MKKFLTFIGFFVFFFSFGFSFPQEEYYSYSYSRLSYVQGDVFVQRGEDLGYEEGLVNLPLVEDDKLGTQEGRAEVHFGQRNYLRISGFTQIDFANLPDRGDNTIKLHLLSGEIFLRINFLENEKDFEINTPDASFYILEEGLYHFYVRENRETELSVYEGAVEAAGEEGSLLVQSKERLTAANGYFQSDPVAFYPSYDDNFSLWNKSRDELLDQIVARRYLPSELYEYEAELASNGRWIYERPYGYVWTPYVYHYQWRPYFYGRWIWYPIIGWNWVSYEPWGWCVYHYGRWHWRAGLGWYWIPTRGWGPAWVHWYSGYNYVGWCPLSYYGYPGVIINNHFYGHYYDRYYPLNSRALIVVRKNQLQAPRISKVALSQSKAIRLGKVSLSSRQPPGRPLLTQSNIKSLAAKKVFSRTSVRQINKSYLSGKKLTPSSSLKSIKSRTPYRLSLKSHSKSQIKFNSIGTRRIVNSKSFSWISAKQSSRLSAKEIKTSKSTPSSISTISRSRLNVKSYPSSKKSPSYSRSKTISSFSTKYRLRPSPSKSSSNSRFSAYSNSKRDSVVKHYLSRISNIFSKTYSSRDSKSQYPTYINRDSRRSQNSNINRRLNYQSLRRSSSRYFSSSRSSSYISPSRNYLRSGTSSRYISRSPSRMSVSKIRSSRSLSNHPTKSSFKSSSSHRSFSSRRSSSLKIKKR